MILFGFRRIDLFLVLMIAGITVSLSAQQNNLFNAPVDSDNQAAVTERLESIADAAVMSGTFKQEKRIKRLNRSFVSSGRFFFSSGNGIVWNIFEPFPSETILTENSIIQKLADGRRNEMNASENAVFRSFSSAMLSVFSGDYEALQHHFRLFYDVEAGASIGLKPIDSTVSSIITSLEISGEGNKIRLLMTEHSGDTIHYVFTIEERRDALVADEKDLFH